VRRDSPKRNCLLLEIGLNLFLVAAIILLEYFNAVAAYNALQYGATMPGLGGMAAAFDR
jgi:hypothetical protein